MGTWLFRIAVNACKQHMIKRRRENTVPLDEAPPAATHDHEAVAEIVYFLDGC